MLCNPCDSCDAGHVRSSTDGSTCAYMACLCAHWVQVQWIPPHERARAVSLTTSGMYLGSAAGMLLLPTFARLFGSASLLRIVGAGGLAWLLLWLAVGKEVPHRCIFKLLLQSSNPSCLMLPLSGWFCLDGTKGLCLGPEWWHACAGFL